MMEMPWHVCVREKSVGWLRGFALSKGKVALPQVERREAVHVVAGVG